MYEKISLREKTQLRNFFAAFTLHILAFSGTASAFSTIRYTFDSPRWALGIDRSADILSSQGTPSVTSSTLSAPGAFSFYTTLGLPDFGAAGYSVRNTPTTLAASLMGTGFVSITSTFGGGNPNSVYHYESMSIDYKPPVSLTEPAGFGVAADSNLDGVFSMSELLYTYSYSFAPTTFLFDSHLIDLTPLGSFAAGAAPELRLFFFDDTNVRGVTNRHLFDNITLIAAIPEPSRAVLLILGYSMLCLRRGRSRT